ncbi:MULTISPECIES: hypothetical protein [unclassified Rhodanobacter]|uniref:Uncharacterized protein n=1 Tax=Rhodanobacter humi TaxID=1888173 RepID=A0ABV4ALY4_9GAMM
MNKESKVKFKDIKTIEELWTRIEGDTENGFTLSIGAQRSHGGDWGDFLNSEKENENQVLVEVSYCCNFGTSTTNMYVDKPTMN